MDRRTRLFVCGAHLPPSQQEVSVFFLGVRQSSQSHLCVCVSLSRPLCDHRFDLCDSCEQGSGWGWGTVLALCLLGPDVISMSHNFGPISSALSPPGPSVPDGLSSGGCFGPYSGWKIWATVHLFLHPWRCRDLRTVPCRARR